MENSLAAQQVNAQNFKRATGLQNPENVATPNRKKSKPRQKPLCQNSNITNLLQAASNSRPVPIVKNSQINPQEKPLLSKYQQATTSFKMARGSTTNKQGGQSIDSNNINVGGVGKKLIAKSAGKKGGGTPVAGGFSQNLQTNNIMTKNKSSAAVSCLRNFFTSCTTTKCKSKQSPAPPMTRTTESTSKLPSGPPQPEPQLRVRTKLQTQNNTADKQQVHRGQSDSNKSAKLHLQKPRQQKQQTGRRLNTEPSSVRKMPMKNQQSVGTAETPNKIIWRLGSPKVDMKPSMENLSTEKHASVSSTKRSGYKMVNNSGKLHKNYSTNFKTGLTTFSGAIRLLEKTSQDLKVSQNDDYRSRMTRLKAENCDSYSAKSLSRTQNKNVYLTSVDQSVNSQKAHGRSGVIRNVDTEETSPLRPNTSRVPQYSTNANKMFQIQAEERFENSPVKDEIVMVEQLDTSAQGSGPRINTSLTDSSALLVNYEDEDCDDQVEDDDQKKQCFFAQEDQIEQLVSQQVESIIEQENRVQNTPPPLEKTTTPKLIFKKEEAMTFSKQLKVAVIDLDNNDIVMHHQSSVKDKDDSVSQHGNIMGTPVTEDPNSRGTARYGEMANNDCVVQSNVICISIEQESTVNQSKNFRSSQHTQPKPKSSISSFLSKANLAQKQLMKQQKQASNDFKSSASIKKKAIPSADLRSSHNKSITSITKELPLNSNVTSKNDSQPSFQTVTKQRSPFSNYSLKTMTRPSQQLLKSPHISLFSTNTAAPVLSKTNSSKPILVTMNNNIQERCPYQAGSPKIVQQSKPQQHDKKENQQHPKTSKFSLTDQSIVNIEPKTPQSTKAKCKSNSASNLNHLSKSASQRSIQRTIQHVNHSKLQQLYAVAQSLDNKVGGGGTLSQQKHSSSTSGFHHQKRCSYTNLTERAIGVQKPSLAHQKLISSATVNHTHAPLLIKSQKKKKSFRGLQSFEKSIESKRPFMLSYGWNDQHDTSTMRNHCTRIDQARHSSKSPGVLTSKYQHPNILACQQPKKSSTIVELISGKRSACNRKTSTKDQMSSNSAYNNSCHKNNASQKKTPQSRKQQQQAAVSLITPMLKNSHDPDSLLITNSNKTMNKTLMNCQKENKNTSSKQHKPDLVVKETIAEAAKSPPITTKKIAAPFHQRSSSQSDLKTTRQEEEMKQLVVTRVVGRRFLNRYNSLQDCVLSSTPRQLQEKNNSSKLQDDQGDQHLLEDNYSSKASSHNLSQKKRIIYQKFLTGAEEEKDEVKSPKEFTALLQGHARISKDLPKGNLDISRIFRQKERSCETNLLDSLSKSLYKARSPRHLLLNEDGMLALNMLSSSSPNLLDEEFLLLNNDDGVDPEDLLKHKGDQDSLILNLLDDTGNDMEENQTVIINGNHLISREGLQQHNMTKKLLCMSPAEVRSSIEEALNRHKSPLGSNDIAMTTQAQQHLMLAQKSVAAGGDEQSIKKGFKQSLSVISEEHMSQWLCDSITSSLRKQERGFLLQSDSLSCRKLSGSKQFHSATKSSQQKQQIYLQQSQSSTGLAKQFYSKLLSAESSKHSKPNLLDCVSGGKISPPVLHGSPSSMRVAVRAFSPNDPEEFLIFPEQSRDGDQAKTHYNHRHILSDDSPKHLRYNNM